MVRIPQEVMNRLVSFQRVKAFNETPWYLPIAIPVSFISAYYLTNAFGWHIQDGSFSLRNYLLSFLAFLTAPLLVFMTSALWVHHLRLGKEQELMDSIGPLMNPYDMVRIRAFHVVTTLKKYRGLTFKNETRQGIQDIVEWFLGGHETRHLEAGERISQRILPSTQEIPKNAFFHYGEKRSEFVTRILHIVQLWNEVRSNSAIPAAEKLPIGMSVEVLMSILETNGYQALFDNEEVLNIMNALESTLSGLEVPNRSLSHDNTLVPNALLTGEDRKTISIAIRE